MKANLEANLKPNELRIGNWFYSYVNGYRVLCAVNCIDENGIKGWYSYDSEADNTNTYSSVLHKPIPLTEEWLFKFGFTKMFQTEDKYTKYGLHFKVWENNVISYIDANNDNRQIYTVHQLQNLFWCLTGEELQIINEV